MPVFGITLATSGVAATVFEAAFVFVAFGAAPFDFVAALAVDGFAVDACLDFEGAADCFFVVAFACFLVACFDDAAFFTLVDAFFAGFAGTRTLYATSPRSSRRVRR